MRQKNFAQVLIAALVLTWLYSGFFRLYIFPNYANFLYFLGPCICILVGAHSLFLKKSQRSFTFVILSTFYFVLFFQSLHFMNGSIDLKILVYGMALYQIPFFLLSETPNLRQINSKLLIEKLVISSVFPNFLLAAAQSLIPNSTFVPELGGSNHLEIANGHVRAFGTFSSTTGFSYYLVLLIAIFWYSTNRYRFSVQSVIWVQISGLIVMSGSRTVLFSLVILMLTKRFLGSRSDLVKKRIYSKFGLIATMSLILIFTLFSQLLSTFQLRLNLASQQENTSSRIFTTLFGFLKNIDTSLLGSGLGSVSTGAFGYSTDVRWIENDFPRILFEFGSILGIVVILGRWIVLILLANSQRRYFGQYRNQRALLIGVLAPLIGYGQWMGQGSLSLGGWITLLLVALIPQDERAVPLVTQGGFFGK